MANPAPTINQINAFNATQGTTIDFNIIGGTELVRSNRIYIYDLSDNSLICTHLYVSTESIHELPPNTDGSIVYESGKSSADFVNGAQYYAQIQTFTDIAGTEGGSGLSVAKMFWCLVDPTLTITTIPSTISTTSYNVSATYNANTSVVSNIIQQYQFSLYSATGSLLQSSGVVVGSGTQQGTSTAYDISYNFSGLSVGSSYYVVVDVTTTQGMSVSAQSSTFTVSIDTPTLGEATVVNNACDGYISVTSNLSSEYGGSGSGEIVSFETDSENVFTKLQVDLEPVQEGSGDPSPSNVRPISGHDDVDVVHTGKNLFDVDNAEQGYLDANGNFVSNMSFRLTNYIAINGGESFTLSYYRGQSASGSGMRFNWFDENKTFIRRDGRIESAVGRCTDTRMAPSNARYLRASLYYSNDSTYASKYQLELGSTATEYEPYQGQSYHQDIEATYTPTVQSTEPYQFKATGEVGGDRESIELVGGSVVWNQLVNANRPTQTVSGVTVTNNGDGSFTFTGTASADASIPLTYSISFQQNHKYFLKANGASDTLQLFDGYGADGFEKGNGAILQFGRNSANGYLYAKVFSGVTYNNTITPMLIDLTQLFGSTIADYIYSLEQATAGSGIAWLKKYYPKLFAYNPYDAGTIKSVEGVSAHKTVGFNQWDEEWENGGIDSDTGNNTSSTTTSRSVNYNPILSNTTYYAKTDSNGIRVYWYDSNKAYLGSQYRANNTFTTPINAAYFRIVFTGTTYQNNVCINLSWDGERNGEYEPYVEHSYPLDSSLTLRGIPKIANGKLYYDGDTYRSDGLHSERYGVKTYDGSVGAWDVYNGVSYASFSGYRKTPNEHGITAIGNSMLFAGQNTGVQYLIEKGRGTFGFRSDTNVVQIYPPDESITTSAQFNAYLAQHPLTFLYEKESPTTEQAEPFESIQEVTPNYGTEEFVTTSIVPVGNNTQYYTREIFGGTLDLVSGVLTVTHGYIASYNGETLPSTWISDRDVYASGTTPTTGAQVVYELAEPQTYQLTPQQIQTLVGQNNVWSEQGDVELSYHIPITNLLVKRQDVADVSGDWLTLYSQPITQSSDMDFTFIDFTNQYGKTYKYALVPLLTQTQSGVEVEVEGGYTVSDEVQSVFDGVFIVDSTGSQKCKANVGYGNVDMNQVVGSITPIGAKYPVVITNSKNQYHNGSISGTIVPDDYYFNGNLSRVDMVNKRNELEQFLTNKRAKIIKDWNGNIWLAMIMDNVSCTFNNNYGMGIVNFNTNWVEVGDPTNQEDLQATGLINVGGA